VDVDRRPDSLADYRGGFMTYDQHTGLDFVLADVDQAEAGVPVLAVRGGTVLETRDGQNDREFSQDSGQLSNFVKVQHADGSTAVYKHLKAYSILVTPGQKIQAGDPIAQVGSSGLSSHPHLHLEVRDADGELVDLLAEELLDLDEAYPTRPYLFDAGISGSSDLRIFSNYFRYTPTHRTSISQSETLYVWYKLLNMGRGDTVHAALIHPDGRQTPLFTLQAQDNRNFDSYFVYANGLSPGYHRVLITLNEQTTPVKDLPFIVEN
jgi:murein DD-endopeptidase MepM/ murein hydrolase activator NlpD